MKEEVSEVWGKELSGSWGTWGWSFNEFSILGGVWVFILAAWGFRDYLSQSETNPTIALKILWGSMRTKHQKLSFRILQGNRTREMRRERRVGRQEGEGKGRRRGGEERREGRRERRRKRDTRDLVCVCVCMFIVVCVRVHVCLHVHMYMCVCTSMYMCMHNYMCESACT